MKSFHNLLGLTSILLMLYLKESLQRPPTNATITKQPTSKAPTSKLPTTTTAIITTNVTTDDDPEDCFSPSDNNDYASYYDSSSKAQSTPLWKRLWNACLDSIITSFEDNLCFEFPDNEENVKTEFYFSSRQNMTNRIQVFPEKKIQLKGVDYKSNRKTVIIIHGFRSNSGTWVLNMTEAFLKWGDVNVIAVDWSGGKKTFNYAKSTANTKTVGLKINSFLKQLMNETGAKAEDFHFVGHSLGAHISAFAANKLGKVGRITGLDPAQPCFRTTNDKRLDKTDAEFVDIIHTNARELRKMGLGLPDPIGHVDFYPNGGMKQPGCHDKTESFINLSKIEAAQCSHKRAHHLFMESLTNKNCTFEAGPWNLSYKGIGPSLKYNCKEKGSCAEMGINAKSTSKPGVSYFLTTTAKGPYCESPRGNRLTPEQDKDLFKNLKWT